MPSRMLPMMPFFGPRSCIPLLLMLIVCMAKATFAGPNVLLLWDDDEGTPVPDLLNANTKALVRAMANAGISVTYSAKTQGRWTGFNPMPNDFDAVVHLNGGGPNSYILPVSAVTRLVQYVRDEGGAYVGSENNAAQMAIPPQFGGLSSAMWDLTLINRVRGWGVTDITVSKIPEQAAHPMLSNLPDSFVFRSGRKEGLILSFDPWPAVPLMTDGWGNHAVAVREFGAGRVVAFNHTGNTAGASTLSNSYVQRLYINAVLWGDQKPPSVLSIQRAGPSPAPAGTVRFTARFSEGVTGVDPGDFAVKTVGEVSFSSPVAMRRITNREYEISVHNITGSGTLAVKLEDNDSIRDRSYNRNMLGGPGPGNGNFTSETYIIDAVPPVLSSFESDHAAAPLGSRPRMTLVFNKVMDETRFPAVLVTASAGHVITASPAGAGGDGLWVNDRAYEVSLDRPVEVADEGVATVTVSDAADFVGNVMLPDDSNTIALIRGDLRIVRQPPPVIYAAAGSSHTFTVEVAGAAGPPQFEWFKEDLAKVAVPVGPNAPAFTIEALDYDDTGVYFCVISDALSVVQTDRSILYVVEAIPSVGIFALFCLAVIVAMLGSAPVMKRYPRPPGAASP